MTTLFINIVLTALVVSNVFFAVWYFGNIWIVGAEIINADTE